MKRCSGAGQGPCEQQGGWNRAAETAIDEISRARSPYDDDDQRRHTQRVWAPPGASLQKILDRLLDERLDGRITAAAQERDRARTLVKQYS